MKNSIVRAVLLTAPLFAFACSSAPSEPELGSAEQALIPFDVGFEPELEEFDAAPPPPPATATCTNITNDGVCRRYCCTESTTAKRCGVLPCPPAPVRDIIWTEHTLLTK